MNLSTLPANLISPAIALDQPHDMSGNKGDWSANGWLGCSATEEYGRTPTSESRSALTAVAAAL